MIKNKNITNRNCIICDNNDYKDIFVFSKEYTNLIENDIKEKQILNEQYGPQVVAKCNICDCKYVRNVVNGISQNSTVLNDFESKRSKKMIIEQNKDFFSGEIEKNNLIKNRLYKLKLLASLTKKNINELSIIDYGCGLGEYPKLSEILGFNKIVAYDPMYSDDHKISYEKSGFNKIEAINNIEQLSKKTKFDVIICTAVIEHAISPKKMFSDLRDISNTDSIILFSNPVMPLEDDISNIEKLVGQKSKKIRIKRYLHYHLGHINYMLGAQIARLVKEYGFKTMPIYPNDSNTSFMVKLKKIYVWVFPKSTRTEYIFKRLN
tara:strand:+ start:391 stop:1353 length:963 start_codon:yes stop_codon:yes gene_type:complete